MSASPHTAIRPRTDDDPRPPEAAPPATGRVQPRRLLAAIVAVILVGGAVVAIERVQAADAAATERERSAAEFALAREVAELRTALAEPARAGHTAASALLRHQLSLLAGAGGDPATGQRLVTELHAAADALELASATPLPERPDILAVASIDPVFARLEGLESQAADVAARFRAAAVEAERLGVAMVELDASATTYAESDPSSSDTTPEAVADVWREELERLADHEAAIGSADEIATLRPIADAHRQLVDGMSALLDEALVDLEQGDLEAHNDRLAAVLGDDDPFGFAAALADARETAGARWADGPLQQSRGLALGLLTELDQLRRAAPAQRSGG